MIARCVTVACLGVAMIAGAGLAWSEEASAEEVPADEVASTESASEPWSSRPFRFSLGAGYPHLLHLSFGYAPVPSWRVSASYVGLPPFVFGGGLQVDYLLAAAAIGKKGFVTASAGMQSMLVKYNFGFVGIQPNGIDWGVGPEVAVDVGVGWFSAGLGVGLMAGDWRCLNRQIGPEVTPSDHVVVTFSVPRLSIHW